MSNTCKKCGHWNGGVVLCEHYAEEAERREQERQVGAELKQLIEDAAKLLGLEPTINVHTGKKSLPQNFDPLDPERGDLWKVAEAAELDVNFQTECVLFYGASNANDLQHPFIKGDHQSLAIAVLRAASAVLHSRGDV